MNGRGGYGPFKVGELARSLGGGYGKDGTLHFGIVTKAGPKQYEVHWEADHRCRYRQDHRVIEHVPAQDIADDVAWYVKKHAELAAAAGLPPCKHPETKRGKDAPRRWGSYRTEVCKACGAFRLRTHPVKGLLNAMEISAATGAWKSALEYAGAIAVMEIE